MDTMKSVADQIGELLPDTDVSALSPHGFASCALLTDWEQVRRLNREVRSIPDCWTPSDGQWPDDNWIIGEDGAGNYFVVSQRGLYEGVRIYDHEWRRFELFKADIQEYVDYCIAVERNADRPAESD